MTFLIDDVELSVEKKKSLAVITLKRPDALNALSLEMIRLMSAGLKKIRKDDDIKAVILQGADSKAFCSGGDLKLASKLGMAYRRGEIKNDIVDMYFKEEYRLDLLFYDYEKPVVALMDGVTMGGGVGIAYPSVFRVATEKTRFAMPEVRIGFFPDVGGTYHLRKWPGHTGLFAITSGYHFKNPSDLLFLGACTHTIPSSRLKDLIPEFDKVLDGARQSDAQDALEKVLNEYHERIGDKGEVEINKDLIDELYSKDSFEETYDAFHEQSNDFMRDVAHLFHLSSPTSIKVAYAYYNMNKGDDFETVINKDALMVRKFVDGHDFYEGVRAILVDKREPSWEPSKLDEVTDDIVESYLGNLEMDPEDRVL